MRAFYLLFLGLPIFAACNPAGIEEATGEVINADPNAEVEDANPDLQGLDAFIPKYKAARCAEEAEADPDEKAKLTEAREALFKQGNELLAAFDQSTDEMKAQYDGYRERLGKAHQAQDCN